MIKVENITKIFQMNEIETAALDQVSLQVTQGEFVSIMGPSGCGRSKASLIRVRNKRLKMYGGLRVKPVMTVGVVAMTVRFVFSCLYVQKNT
jgi:ABC-type nitrate/sulfonate/bicarbonate transport system ATPase subunit